MTEKDENFKRPQPSRPIKPEVPEANRYQQDKIFLEYADSLYKVNTADTIERQILKGQVKFRQAGMWMFCDSAYYYPEQNSLDAFGNVRMEQGDTLFVYADKLYYQGNEKLAKLINGPSEPKVRLINKEVTLTTDSLDYDLANEWGWYLKWGTIDDRVNNLTSLEGYYSPNTKEAEFYQDVILVNNDDGYTLLTDTLFYNTTTHIARIESLATIQSETDTIITKKAIYDTEKGNADLLTRSLLIHVDSTGNVTTLEGDSIIYDKATRISKAYMYRDPDKLKQPMVLTDTAQKTTLIGGFGIYNDSTREAMSFIYPLLLEYSKGDTLFLRADTIKTFIVTEKVAQPKKRMITDSPMIAGNPLVVIDSLKIFLDSTFFEVKLPFYTYPLDLISRNTFSLPVQEEDMGINYVSEENDNDDKIEMFTEESIDDYPLVVADSIAIPEIDNADIKDFSEESLGSYEIIENEKEDKFTSDEIKIEKEDSVEYVYKDFHVALAYPNGRFFKKDIQGVADSILVMEKDSMMYMFRKPIIWSGERQVAGNRIDVHFNDSTADWARLPESGLMSEHVDEDFFNQISGKTLFATFADQTLKTLDVSGNVETIFLPQESDSTFNRLVAAESSFLFVEMKDGEMERLKMWPEVNGTVTPIFLVKKSQQFLRNFKWWESIRPVRNWYGDGVLWAEDLGEVPEILESYFLSPSDFGEPKSFSSSRFVPPVSSLPIFDDIEAVAPSPDSEMMQDIIESENDIILSKESQELNEKGENLEKSVTLNLSEELNNNETLEEIEGTNGINESEETISSISDIEEREASGE